MSNLNHPPLNTAIDLNIADPLTINKVMIVGSKNQQTSSWSKTVRQTFGSSTEIHEVTTARNAVRLLQSQVFEIVLIDHRVEAMHPLALLDALLEISADLAIVMIVRKGSELLAAEALKHGAYDYYLEEGHCEAMMPEMTLPEILKNVLQKIQGVQQESSMVSELEQSQQEMNLFVRALSHDMNANMMVLEYSFQKLKKSVKQPSLAKVLNDVQHVEACLQGSKHFLDDLTTLSQHGNVDMQPEKIELAEIVHAVINQQQQLIQKRNVKIHIEDHLPEVYIHPRRLNQVLTNLIHNALKYGCDEADPRLTISTVAGKSIQSTKEFLWLRIYDNGRGIAPSDSQNIFTPGVRLPSSNHQSGSGMGLAIVKRIVEQNGGEVYLDPHCKQGTAFILSIARQPIPKSTTKNQPCSLRTDAEQPTQQPILQPRSPINLSNLNQNNLAAQPLPSLPSSTLMSQR